MKTALVDAYDTIANKIKELVTDNSTDEDDAKVQYPAQGSPAESTTPSPPVERKTVFWVRHGESEWNVVQETVLKKIMSNPLKIASVFSQFRDALNQEDVRLTSQGVKQALATGEHFLGRRSDDEQIPDAEFIKAQTIVFSPLTRAMCTGMYALQNHEYFRTHNKHAYLHPGIREIRRSLSHDSVGTPKDGLLARIDEVMPDIKDAPSMVDTSTINENVWWTDEKYVDTTFVPGIYEENPDAIREQLQDFFKWLRPHPGPVIIVSHSIKIRKIMQMIGDEHSRATWGKGKVPYAAVLRTSMEWAPTLDETEPMPVIRDADLVFDPTQQSGNSPVKIHTEIQDYFKPDGSKFSIKIGQPVAVWSVNKAQWFRDGVIDQVAPDGQSIHVSYDRDSLWLGSKWIALRDIGAGKVLQFPPYDTDERVAGSDGAS